MLRDPAGLIGKLALSDAKPSKTVLEIQGEGVTKANTRRLMPQAPQCGTIGLSQFSTGEAFQFSRGSEGPMERVFYLAPVTTSRLL